MDILSTLGFKASGAEEVKVVSAKRILIVGLILAIFNPPKIGLIYAACFAFYKETRKAALIVALWSFVWLIIYSNLLGFLLARV